MTHAGLLDRLIRGTGWTWVDDRHRAALPADLHESIMSWRSDDRHHAKQGRSTARFRLDGPAGRLAVYLKRHDRLPWMQRLRALVLPGDAATPGAAEWRHLERARGLGIAVPEVVAVGERIGPRGRLQGFLMLAELVGREALNEALPGLSRTLCREDFARLKRQIIAEMAAIAATLHNADLFHKDLYLCHFFLDPAPGARPGGRLTLIDLHRLGRHRLATARWRVKDLGQLLFSTLDVAGIDDRDRLRFWSHYRRRAGLRSSRWWLRAIRAKAARYRAHNR